MIVNCNTNYSNVFRIKATDDQIKRAHRQKVLRHHPDKRKAAGEDVKQDNKHSIFLLLNTVCNLSFFVLF